ncbi:hypothetical protein [Methanococcoides alaskense]|uniref:Uncharacterized protein n=1 Tax=Methanococcoides alaskense TaxID=325778 RepID=A0AA90TZI9_9EURY|nr:hypothetical protein [Methanococcoides alaskense]MDA0525646.1 hypothetical protein [Methanococcoides alaskense]MDR6222872.1 hypothetical protein [Methanococcoides alaskense]
MALEDSLPDVVINMPCGGLAFAANVPENQVEVMRYIDNSPVPEELKEKYKTKIQDIWDRYPDKITEDDYQFMHELGRMIFSSALDEEERAAGTIDNSNSIFVDNESEQKIGSVFTGMMAIAVVLLCFYLIRKWK